MLYEEQEFINGCKITAKIKENQMHIMLSEDKISEESHAKDLCDKIAEYCETIPKRTRDQIDLKEKSLEKWAQKFYK